jgi:hypothetical protein
MSRQVRHHFFIGGPDHGFVRLKDTGAEAPFLLDRHCRGPKGRLFHTKETIAARLVSLREWCSR